MNNEFLKMFQELAIVFPAFVLVLTFRGFFRALVAWMMGDHTAAEEGFLTLNPVAHIDIIGLTMILLVLFVFASVVPNLLLVIILVMFGVRWSHEVPIDERNFKHPTRGIVFTSLSGPLGNFFLALLSLYAIAHFPVFLFPKHVTVPLLQIFQTIVQFSIFFGVFNLLPVPPFDGGLIVLSLIPRSWEGFRNFLEENSLFVVIALLVLFTLMMPLLGRIVLLIERGLWYLVI